MQLTLAPGRQEEAQGTRGPVAGSAGGEPRLTLLGGFGLHLGDKPAPMPPGPQRLIALLALHEEALSRDCIAGVLWGDSTETRASGSLRSALWKLRVVRSEIVLYRGSSLGLSPHVHVDVRRATTFARSAVMGGFARGDDRRAARAPVLPRTPPRLVRRVGPGREGAAPPAKPARARVTVRAPDRGRALRRRGASAPWRRSTASHCARARTARWSGFTSPRETSGRRSGGTGGTRRSPRATSVSSRPP